MSKAKYKDFPANRKPTLLQKCVSQETPFENYRQTFLSGRFADGKKHR
jgi:hypothetical protein